MLTHYDAMPEVKDVIPYARVRSDYYDLCRTEEFRPEAEANVCMSCATCRDCKMCEATCPCGVWEMVENY